MKLEIQWSAQFEADLKHLPDWKIAAALSATVIEFAETGRGVLRRIESSSGLEWRLYSGQFYAVVMFSDREATLYVLGAFKTTGHLALVTDIEPKDDE